jgi:putative ABC transport system ATP-binding protein
VIFQELHEKGITLVLVTHDPDIARHAERIISLRDGRIISDEMVEGRLDAREILSRMPERDISA